MKTCDHCGLCFAVEAPNGRSIISHYYCSGECHKEAADKANAATKYRPRWQGEN